MKDRLWKRACLQGLAEPGPGICALIQEAAFPGITSQHTVSLGEGDWNGDMPVFTLLPGIYFAG